MKSANELFQAGQLTPAVQAAVDGVKNAPADRTKRFLLAELLAFAGDLERADKHLDAIASPENADLLAVLQFRQLLRAEGIRQQVFAEGRSPNFLTNPGDQEKARLEALMDLRQGKAAAAANRIATADDARPKVSGTCDGNAFDDIRDLDDVVGPFLEVITAKGTYYWVPFSHLKSVDFHKPDRPRDVLWRKAKLVAKDGLDGDVFVPTLYVNTAKETDDELRVGRATEWRGQDGEPIRGIGHRQLLVGEDAKALLTISKLAFE
jgi:type VI secretion system protein ImpE